MVKYLLVVPHGGFNDCLGLILRSIEYCKKYSRTLLLHMRRPIYNINFSDFFDVLPSIECEIIYDFNIINDLLSNNQYSVYPDCLNNLLKGVLYNTVRIMYRDVKSAYFFRNVELSLPSNVVEADVIVFSSGGGGKGYTLFQNLTMKDGVKQHCRQRLALLSDDNYLCIHVRNTDYKCDYQKLYSDNKELINSFGKIYVATDDKHVITFFKTKHPNVFNFTQFPKESRYRSLHTSSINPVVKMNDMLCDIFIAANSKQILSNSRGGYINLMRDCFDNKDFIMNKLQ
jgi:hypothetical protein